MHNRNDYGVKRNSGELAELTPRDRDGVHPNPWGFSSLVALVRQSIIIEINHTQT
jgi:hypothetical protein